MTTTPTVSPASGRAREAKVVLANYGRFPSAGAVPYDVVVRIVAALLDERRILADQASVGDADASGSGVRVTEAMINAMMAVIGSSCDINREEARYGLEAALSSAPSAHEPTNAR